MSLGDRTWSDVSGTVFRCPSCGSTDVLIARDGHSTSTCKGCGHRWVPGREAKRIAIPTPAELSLPTPADLILIETLCADIAKALRAVGGPVGQCVVPMPGATALVRAEIIKRCEAAGWKAEWRRANHTLDTDSLTLRQP